MEQQTKFPSYLLFGYAGTLPFIAAAILSLFGVTRVEGISVVDAASSYGLLIAAFMSGVQWGIYPSIKRRLTINLYLISNITAVATWLAYLLLSSHGFFLFLLATFILLYIVDQHLFRLHLLEVHYLKMRFWLTMIVAISLIIMLM